MTERAAGTNRSFGHTVTTSASPQTIWDLWVDVDRWGEWDDGLKSARADRELGLGVSGTVTPNRGPDSNFEVTVFEPIHRYTFETKFPGARLVITRTLTEGPPTTFRHDVAFVGPMAAVWALIFGRGFRSSLITTMADIKRLAESGERSNPF